MEGIQTTPPLAVLVPTTGERPGPLRRAIDTLNATVTDVQLYVATWTAPLRTPWADGGVLCIVEPQTSYAKAINLLAEKAVADGHEWLFLGADDIAFHPGWYEAALDVAEGYDVIGTNDLGNPRVIAGQHATHSLVRASYLEWGTVDGPGLMCEDYRHNFTDDEFVETAKAREAFIACADSHVEHMHPAWGKATLDSTYDVATSEALFEQDQATFVSRAPMWRKAVARVGA